MLTLVPEGMVTYLLEIYPSTFGVAQTYTVVSVFLPKDLGAFAINARSSACIVCAGAAI